MNTLGKKLLSTEQDSQRVGKSASGVSSAFQESKREILLIGDEIDRIFLGRSPSPLLPDAASEKDIFFLLALEEECEESSGSDLVQDTGSSETSKGARPVEWKRQETRDESDRIDQQLTKLRRRVEEMSFRLKQL